MYRRSRTFFTCNLNRESLQNTVCFHMTFYSKRALSHVCHIATWPSLQRSIWFHQFKVWCVPYQIGSTLNWYLVSGEKTGEYTAISKGWPCKTVSPGSSCSVINKVEIQKIDWFFFYCLTSRSRIFQSYRDVERRRCICRIRKKVGGGGILHTYRQRSINSECLISISIIVSKKNAEHFFFRNRKSTIHSVHLIRHIS